MSGGRIFERGVVGLSPVGSSLWTDALALWSEAIFPKLEWSKLRLTHFCHGGDRWIVGIFEIVNSQLEKRS